MKNIFLIILTIVTTNSIFSQTDIDQNGLKSTVISGLQADAAQARRFEIATVGYNSHHWQVGGIIIVELYEASYGTGYEKYIIENGFGQGVNSGSPVLKLLDSHGAYHSGKIVLGTPTDLTSSLGDYINKQLPILFDVRDYASYKIKITYLQDKVNELSSYNQIKINQNPIGNTIPDFAVSTELNNDLHTNGTLKVSGNGNHYIQNGNVGIGTTTPDSKLTVAGNIHAQEVKVTTTAGSVPDYVFTNDYKLRSLKDVEDFIKQNSHLPEIPSAKEIEKNGLMLAEMNMNLLKKIEELTLYSIDQNKKINTQEKEIESLKELVLRVTKIETQLASKVNNNEK
jgi:hypothetical protein